MENSDLIIGVLTVVALGLLCAWLLTLHMYRSEKKEVKKWVSRTDYNGKERARLEADLSTMEQLYEKENSINRELRIKVNDLELKVRFHVNDNAERIEQAIKDRADDADIKESEEDFDDSELDELTKTDSDDEETDAGD